MNKNRESYSPEKDDLDPKNPPRGSQSAINFHDWFLNRNHRMLEEIKQHQRKFGDLPPIGVFPKQDRRFVRCMVTLHRLFEKETRIKKTPKSKRAG